MTLPNALTLAGLGCGLFAIDASADGRVGAAVTWIVAALLFDRLDGLVARKMGLTSAVGARLDSLADLVSFGVAPFFVARATDGGTPTLLAGLAYALAAAWRLASFEEVGLVESRFGRAFVGLPTPAAAAWLVVLISLVPATPGVLPIVLLVAAVAMCSSLLYPKGGPLLGVTVVALVASLVVQWGLVGLPW